MEVGSNRYGKFNVQLLRVVRDSPVHEIYQYDCQMMSEGKSLTSSFVEADNSKIVPTDTQKNTLFAMAKKFPITPQETWSVCSSCFILSHA
jgi:urate oxidase